MYNYISIPILFFAAPRNFIIFEDENQNQCIMASFGYVVFQLTIFRDWENIQTEVLQKKKIMICVTKY